MTPSQIYYLMAAVFVAPHLPAWLGIYGSAAFFICWAAATWLESRKK